MLEADLVAFLEADAGVTAEVDGRIYPLVLPQAATVPAIVYQRVDGPRVRSHQGPSGLQHPRIQLTCWDVTLDGAVAAAKAVRVALDGYSGPMGDTDVDAVHIVNDLDDYDPITNRFRRIVDAVIWAEEETT